MLSIEQKKRMLLNRAKECKKDNVRINAEIDSISNFLYGGSYLMNYQVEYLQFMQYKLFDLIHSYLLNEKLICEAYDFKGYKYSLIKHNLKRCDYSIQSNRLLIDSLLSNTDERDYWYDVPHFKKTMSLIEIID